MNFDDMKAILKDFGLWEIYRDLDEENTRKLIQYWSRGFGGIMGVESSGLDE